MGRSDNEEIRTAEYLAAAVADEMELAKLLGWTHITAPSEITPNAWVFGRHLLARGFSGRNASAPCPRYRRAWEGAGLLIGACTLSMIVGETRVAVGAGPANTLTFYAEFTDHPTRDDAIRYAMCKAAIAYLSAKPSEIPSTTKGSA